MKNIFSKPALHLLFTIFLLITFNLCHAQDTIRYNKISTRAPKNVKIDGKATEWGDKIKNYSFHTQFYYSVSNDDKFLYLTVQTADDYIINRILKGGITLTINKSDKKKDPNGIHITYPLLYHFDIRFQDAPRIKDKSAINVARIDTFVNTVNDKMEKVSKMIRVSGIRDIDSVISVYNFDGIKAAATLDHQMRYTYELAVSLTNLGLSVQEPLKFAYQVMINQTDDTSSHSTTPGGILVIVTTNSSRPQEATDFWGEYILAK